MLTNEQENLRKEFLRLTIISNTKDFIEVLNIYSTYFLNTIRNHHYDKVFNNAERDAKMINQMILTKILHIKEVIKGVQLEPNANNIIDPTIVATLTRNLYETVCMFNLIYRNTKTNDEKLITYNLWVIAGLNYRQKFLHSETKEENKIKDKLEKKEIEKLKKEIEDSILYVNLNEKDKNKIQTKIKEKDFKIRFDDNKVIFLNWQDLSKIMGDKTNLFDNIYTYFSLYAHPSNVAVFQFGEMFNKGENTYLSMTNFNLKYFVPLLSIFVSDYIYLFPNVLSTFENQPIINQLVINGYNKLYRGDSYSINDSSKRFG